MNSPQATTSPPPKPRGWLQNAINAGWEVYTTHRPSMRALGPGIDFWAAGEATIRSLFARFGGGAKVTHVKRQSSYLTIAMGHLQCSAPIAEGTVLYAYVGEDGKVWFRPLHEFEDGRFVRHD